MLTGPPPKFHGTRDILPRPAHADAYIDPLNRSPRRPAPEAGPSCILEDADVHPNSRSSHRAGQIREQESGGAGDLAGLDGADDRLEVG